LNGSVEPIYGVFLHGKLTSCLLDAVLFVKTPVEKFVTSRLTW